MLSNVEDLQSKGQDFFLPLPTSLLCKDQRTAILMQPFIPAWQPGGDGPRYIFQIGTWQDHVNMDAFYDALTWSIITPVKKPEDC